MITKKRPLLDLKTPLRLIPKQWLDIIEPRILRPSDTSCWLWDGATDRDGEPIISVVNAGTGKRSTRRVKRIVAELYWDMRKDHDVIHECGTKNCLAPFHFYISPLHWTQENRAQLVKRRGDRISRWGKNRE